MSSLVLCFQEIDTTKLTVVGGKGANLGELSKVEGIHVPDGFCVSTIAFKRIIGETSLIHELLDQLSLLEVEDRDKISELCGEIRRVIEGIAIAENLDQEITRTLSRIGEKDPYAVRSSATAEDLPLFSFAGQQDTYLNIIGKESILKHISKCWASDASFGLGEALVSGLVNADSYKVCNGQVSHSAQRCRIEVKVSIRD